MAEMDRRFENTIVVVDVGDMAGAQDPYIRQVWDHTWEAYRTVLGGIGGYLAERGLLPAQPEIILMTPQQAMDQIVPPDRPSAKPLLVLVHDENEETHYGISFCSHFLCGYGCEDHSRVIRTPMQHHMYNGWRVIENQDFQEKVFGVLAYEARKKAPARKNEAGAQPHAQPE